MPQDFVSLVKSLIFSPKSTLMRILRFSALYVILLLSFAANAQVSIGIKGGPDFARMLNIVEGSDGSSGITKLNSGTVTQFYGGIFADIPLDKKKMFYLRPGVNYVGAGGSTNPTGNYYNPNGFEPLTKYNLHYIDIPVEFVYSPGFDWGRPFVGFGFYTGLLVNGTIKGPDGSRPAMIGSDENDDFLRSDIGYAFTLGLATKVGFMFGLDYQHGLTRILPDGTEQSNQVKLQTRNSIFGLHVGWIFKL